MKEYLITGNEVCFFSYGYWYKMPWYVIQDIVQDCIKQSQTETAEKLKSWINSAINPAWAMTAIPSLKDILREQLKDSSLMAYRLSDKLPNPEIGPDNICPSTNLPCDDECCPPGATCNVSTEISDIIRPDQIGTR